MFTAVSGLAVVALAIFSLILTILWIVMPFAVFRIRREIIGARADLKAVRNALEKVNKDQAKHPTELLRQATLTNQILAAVHNVELPGA